MADNDVTHILNEVCLILAVFRPPPKQIQASCQAKGYIVTLEECEAALAAANAKLDADPQLKLLKMMEALRIQQSVQYKPTLH